VDCCSGAFAGTNLLKIVQKHKVSLILTFKLSQLSRIPKKNSNDKCLDMKYLESGSVWPIANCKVILLSVTLGFEPKPVLTGNNSNISVCLNASDLPLKPSA
jgi:hypothetical protein